MTLRSRKAAREAFATLLSSNISSLQVVFNYVPNSFDGQSPVATVSSWGMYPRFNVSVQTNTIGLIVGVWTLRVNKEQSVDYSADAEDELDNISGLVADEINSWDNAVIARVSETDYAIIDGAQYRVESHFITIEHWET